MPTYVGSTQASAIYKGSALLTDVYVGVVGGGAGYATGTLIETYESTSGFTPSAQTSMSLDTTLQLDALAGLSGASGIAEAYKLGVFTVSTNTTADIGLQVTQVNIDLDSDRQVGSLGVYFGKTSGAMAGALQSAPLPFGETWVASHVSENATLEGLTAGSFGIKPAAISGTSPYGGKVKFGATYIKVHARPTIAMVLDDCMAVQDAHIQAILDRGLVATRVIPSSFVGGGSNSSLATLLAQQAAGIALIPNATRNDQAVNTFGNRAAALAEMDASKAACAALGFNAEGLDYSVWPNGYFTDSATLKPATMTGDGTTTVTFSGAKKSSSSAPASCARSM